MNGGVYAAFSTAFASYERTRALQKIALIGHSASGKTSTLEALGIDPLQGDMDRALGQTRCPAPPDALRWIVDESTPRIVTVSNFIKLIRFFNLASRQNRYPEYFERILWVYLRKSRKRLARHLVLPKACGYLRPEADTAIVVDEYGRFSKHFNSLADHTIYCDRLRINDVAEHVRVFAKSLSMTTPSYERNFANGGSGNNQALRAMGEPSFE